MLRTTFTTHGLLPDEQFTSWRGWYDSLFETTSGMAEDDGFEAANRNWTLGGLTLSEVSSPPTVVRRSRALVRRNPVDHWAVTLSSQTESEVTAREQSFRVPRGVPFLLSMGEEMHIERTSQDVRLQVFLSRDEFGSSAPLLDAGRGMMLEGPPGALLAEFLWMLKKNLPTLVMQDASHLKRAVQAMVEACLAPTAERRTRAERAINATLMERVRSVVQRHLRSPSLGTAKLCREAATSRSQLYRLLENEGGVAHYILRRRLSESFTILCDTSSDLSIGRIAEVLCFADASGFSRAFRREFGINPKEVRAAALCGLPTAPPPSTGGVASRFSDCLCSF